MKKRVKKLALAKETVRKLENGQLAEAAGGYTYSCGPEASICVEVEPSYSC